MINIQNLDVKELENLKESIKTEEATKTSLIMPFFSMLGYDVFNPMEFVPEYIADVGIKKGEKVDLGNERNEAAVKDGLAEWVKSTEKKEETPAKTTSSAKGKPVETKAKK